MEGLEQKRDAAIAELDKVNSEMTDKQTKLDIADEQLENALSLRDKYLKEASEYREIVEGFASDILNHAEQSIAAAAMGYTIKDINSNVSAYAFSANTFIHDVATYGTRLLECATCLFIGYVDRATTIAENCGGGGGSDNSSWGRKEDEDDMRWAQRCLAMASQMMKSKPNKSLKRK